ncbi:hypothetical protein RDABS01_025953, partial [Bienertia sinuspersici]
MVARIKGITLDWDVNSTRPTYWAKAVWNCYSLPKHRFIPWLVLQQRLQTRERLAHFGICQSELCLLCELECETQNHLFFSYPYSKVCWTKVKQWLVLKARPENVYRLVRWIERGYIGSKFQRKVIYAFMTALVYMLWKAWNEVLWNAKLSRLH